MNEVISYLITKYSPLAIVVYGSFASGTNDSSSDFDAVVITKDTERMYDGSLIHGITLDVYIFPESAVANCRENMDVRRLCDGLVVLDTNGIGERLVQAGRDYYAERHIKTLSENRTMVNWCVTMCERARRNDAEGAYRRHLLLTASLEICFDILEEPFKGPKKSIARFRELFPHHAAIYERALLEDDMQAVEDWVNELRMMLLMKTLSR